MKNYYKLKKIAIIAILFPALAVAQNSYTFTSAAATGATGPTQTQINTAYASTNLNGSVTVSGGIQSFTIPLTGPYRITAIGAQGGYNGGSPASIAGEFTLTAGTVLKILVGQMGTQTSNGSSYISAGGGGGSYVTTNANVPYVVAGGGGGNGDGYSGVPVGCCLNGMQAATVTAGNPFPTGSNGGTTGNGGTCGSPTAGGGAGVFGNGSACSAGSAAISFTNGGQGGGGGGSPAAGDGGFGGGAGGYNSGVGQRGGGGGGYSGGGGGTANTGNDAAGGGGGSFNSGVNQINAISTSTGNGRVIIDLLCFLNITASTPSPTAPAICTGNSVTLTTNAVSGYSWSTGSTSNSIVVSPGSTQTYSVTGTSSLSCSTAAFITVTVSSGLPVLSVSNPSNNICLGKSATLTASGALTYTWTSGVTNGVPFAPSATSSYTVTGRNGCGTATALTSVTIAPLAVFSLASPTLICAGSTATLTAASAVAGYTWQPLGIPGQTAVVSPLANTIYTVTASDGICNGTSTVAIFTQATPTITALASTSVVCENGTVTLSATGGTSYTWTPGGIGGTVTVNPTSPTLYQVVGSNSLGCSSLATAIVLTNPSPTIVASTANTLVCQGGTAVLTGNGALTYTWVNGPVNSSYTVNPQTTSSYTVTGANSGGCTDTKVVTVSVFNPSVNVTSVSSGICPGGTATLIASGATTYTWSNGLGNNSSVLATPLVNTIYTVTAKTTSNSVSCTATNTVLVSLFNLPTITIVATKTVMCRKDANAILTAQGGTAYVWSNFAITPTLTASSQVVTNTTYSVTGTDNNGCVNTGTILIKVNTCTGIDELNSSQNTIRVYPNPSNGEFTVSSENTISVKLINQIGQEIRLINLSGQNDHKVSVSDLPSGVYFIVGQNQTEKVNQKIIITK